MKKLSINLVNLTLCLGLHFSLYGLEIEQDEWEEIKEIGVQIQEELLDLTEEKIELEGIIRELKVEVEDAAGKELREIEMELSRLQLETRSLVQLIRLHENQLLEHKKVLIAKEGRDEEVFWQTLENFHRIHDGFHLRTELIYLTQENQLLSSELKFLKSSGEKRQAHRVEGELHLAEVNLVAHRKLLEKREALEALWKKDPHADTEELEEEFWMLNEKNELQRIENELIHSQKTLAMEHAELQKAQKRLEQKRRSLQIYRADLTAAKKLFEKREEARISGNEDLLEELEEKYHLHRESLYLKREIDSMQEHLQHLIEEGETEKAEEMEIEIKVLRRELETLEK